MSYYYQTQVPNILFDKYLTDLSQAELKILLIIIRQTFGWVDKETRKPKQWDWISRQFFVKKTSLSLRAVSEGISKLQEKGYIKIKNQNNQIVTTAKQRKQANKLYYAVNLSTASAKNCN